MDYIGEMSAATLGYITANRRGANLARGIYKTYRKNMAPVRRGRSRTRSPRGVLATPQSTPDFRSTNPFRSRVSSSRSVSMGRRSSLSSRYSSIASTIKSADSSNVQQKANRKKGRKVHKEGVKKRVKIPKKLRKQVKEILESKGPTGTLLDIKYFKLTPTDSQEIIMLGNTTENNPNLFDPCWIQYVASVLFNGAAATTTPLIGNANYFTPRTLRVEVIKQSVTYRCINNSARTLTLKFWDISPKSRNFGNGFNPLTFWTSQFQIEAANSPANPNVFGITPQTLYAHPKLSAAFRNLYQLDETIVNLEAGKEYVHKVKGPNMKLYDFQKYWSGSSPTAGVFDNQQSFIKQTMLCVYNDITATSLGTYGRFTDMSAASPYGLVIEQSTYTKICMPEQAGFAWPAVTPTTGNQTLNKRQSVYAVSNWAGSQTGVVTKIEDENPQAQTTTGV